MTRILSQNACIFKRIINAEILLHEFLMLVSISYYTTCSAEICQYWHWFAPVVAGCRPGAAARSLGTRLKGEEWTVGSPTRNYVDCVLGTLLKVEERYSELWCSRSAKLSTSQASLRVLLQLEQSTNCFTVLWCEAGHGVRAYEWALVALLAILDHGKVHS